MGWDPGGDSHFCCEGRELQWGHRGELRKGLRGEYGEGRWRDGKGGEVFRLL